MWTKEKTTISNIYIKCVTVLIRAALKRASEQLRFHTSGKRKKKMPPLHPSASFPL